ncbi:MAG TPA: hypothetical protein VGP36_02080 [Mycobacteriales bacterium]|nr:hypothetical protein [Mycobacteriales bacterium]
MKRIKQSIPGDKDVRRRPWRRIATVSVLTPLVAFGALAVSATGAEAAVPAGGGEVVSWGNGNAYSQGPGGVTDVPAAASPAIAVAGGLAHSLSVTSGGKVVAWGKDYYGETQVPAAAQSGVSAVAAGFYFSVALKSDGSVLAWGLDDHGQTDVPAAAQSGVTAISVSDGQALALKSDGSVVEWGWDLSSNATLTPPPATVSSGVVSIAAGRNWAMAAKSDGSVVAWGKSCCSSGVLTLPASVSSGVTKVAAGLGFGLALKSDGSVVGWGTSGKGETTLPPATQSGVTAIAAGEHYGMALKSTGSVVTWGDTSSDGAAPTPATLGSSVVAIAGGYYNGMAIRTTLPSISGTPTPAVLGKPYDFGLTLGGYPAPSVELRSGSLPAGLSLTGNGHITGTPTKAGQSTFVVRTSTPAGEALANVTVTVQPAHSTSFQFIDPPASVATAAFESDDYVRSFAERYNQVLTSDLTVGGTTVPTGTRVNVYYVHADHVGDQNLATKFAGSEWFGTKVLATATSTADLQATTALFGAPGTAYSSRADQGLEFDDTATRWIDQNGIDFSLNSWSASDAVRIIALAP